MVDEAMLLPKPVHGTIPIWIGARGPRMMHYTGAVADGWMKNGGWPESLEQLKELVGLLEEGAEEAGRDPRTIRRVLNGAAAIGDGAQAASGGLVGTADQILEIIETYREIGVDTFYLGFRAEGREEQMRRFGQEVIARVR